MKKHVNKNFIQIIMVREIKKKLLKPIRGQSAANSVTGIRYLKLGNKKCKNSVSPKNGRPKIQIVK